MIPYVSIRTSTDGANVLNRNARDDMILPAIVTGRQPNLFVRALTTGPAKKKMYLCM